MMKVKTADETKMKTLQKERVERVRERERERERERAQIFKSSLCTHPPAYLVFQHFDI
jgi:hypothetical protein